MVQPMSSELAPASRLNELVIVRNGNEPLSFRNHVKLFTPPSFEGGDFDGLSDERRLSLYLEGQGVHASIDRTLGRVGLTRGFLFRTYKGDLDSIITAHDLLKIENDRATIELVIRAFLR